MTAIRNYFTNLLIARPPAGGDVAPAAGAAKGEDAGEPGRAQRTVLDTVTLSEGGHKIVNLERGRALAREIRAAPVDEDFAANLLKAREDVSRITRLLNIDPLGGVIGVQN